MERELRSSGLVYAILDAATDPMQKSSAGLMLGYARHSEIDMASTLKTFPLTLRTVEGYARGVLGMA